MMRRHSGQGAFLPAKSRPILIGSPHCGHSNSNVSETSTRGRIGLRLARAAAASASTSSAGAAAAGAGFGMTTIFLHPVQATFLPASESSLTLSAFLQLGQLNLMAMRNSPGGVRMGGNPSVHYDAAARAWQGKCLAAGGFAAVGKPASGWFHHLPQRVGGRAAIDTAAPLRVSSAAMNDYDKAGRYLIKRDPPGFFRWLLRRPDAAFHAWIDARRHALPDQGDLTNDLVAAFRVGDGFEALCVELQAESEGGSAARLAAGVRAAAC